MPKHDREVPMKLDPQIAKEVEKALGEPLPRPDDEAFETLLRRLDREAPELADTLRSGLVHEELGDIETEARKHSQKDMRRRRLKRALLMRYDELEGEWHLSKLKALVWGSLGALGVMAMMFLGAPLLSGSEVAAQPEEVEEAAPREQAPVAEQDADPFAGLPEELEQNERTAVTFAGAQPVPTPEPPEAQAQEHQEPMLADEAGEPSDTGTAEEPSEEQPMLSEEPMLSESPLLPGTESEEELGLAVYSAAAGAEELPQGLKAYGSGGGGDPGSNQSDPFAEPEASQGGPVGLAAYSRAEPAQETPTGLMAYRSEVAVENNGVRLYTQETPEPSSTAEETSLQQGVQPSEANTSQQAALKPERIRAATEVAQLPVVGLALAQGEGGRTSPPPRRPKNPYSVGDSVTATLQVGVVAVDGTPLPVLARGDDGSVWQGQATLTPTGRVDIRFSEVLKEGRRHPVSAIAQAGDGYLGLPAQITETTPAFASDLARGALRGLSEYVQALGQQTEVRVEGSTPIINRNAPPLEASVAGSVARLFTPPEGEEQQALVRLARVPAGTPVNLVVLTQRQLEVASP